MESNLKKLLPVLLGFLSIADLADSAGNLTIQFLQYTSHGRIASGAPCDSSPDLATQDPCDPQFRVTADRTLRDGQVVIDANQSFAPTCFLTSPNKRYFRVHLFFCPIFCSNGLFAYQQTGVYINQDTVHFVSTFGELSNPIVIGMNYDDNQGSIYIAISVSDTDADSKGQLMSQFNAQLKASGTEVTYLELKIRTNQTLTLRYWYSCSINYYGPLCNKLCRTSNSIDHGHGWCNSNGDRSCLYGWVKVSTGCKTPHPCRTCVCQNGGTCVPDGDEGYRCQCHAGYTGVNCEKCYYNGSQCSKNENPDSNCDLVPVLQTCTHASSGISTGALVGSIVAFFIVGSIATCAVFCFCRTRRHV